MIDIQYDAMFTGSDDLDAAATALTPLLHVFCLPAPAPSMAQLTIVTLDCTAEGPVKDIAQACDWAAFDSAAASAATLQRVVCGFRTRETLMPFAHEVADTPLATLARNHKLKYAVRDKKDIIWMRVTADLDVVEGAT